jgi:hypothetical protein
MQWRGRQGGSPERAAATSRMFLKWVEQYSPRDLANLSGLEAAMWAEAYRTCFVVLFCFVLFDCLICLFDLVLRWVVELGG